MAAMGRRPGQPRKNTQVPELDCRAGLFVPRPVAPAFALLEALPTNKRKPGRLGQSWIDLIASCSNRFACRDRFTLIPLPSDFRRHTWYIYEERHWIGANGKATVPGVGFDSL